MDWPARRSERPLGLNTHTHAVTPYGARSPRCGLSSRVLDDLSTGFPWAVRPPATLIVGGVGDVGLVNRIIAEHLIDAIAHFIAKMVVLDSVTGPLLYYLNNIAKARSLFDAQYAGRSNFIFSSTAAVYGGTTMV
jgi:UDP-glucose 4-epimerase